MPVASASPALSTSELPHVLLVDDEEDFVEVTQLLLTMEGFAVTAALDSVDAVRQVEQGALAPDVVMLDHRMPVLTGPMALRAMRAAGLQAPALLVSAIHDIDREAHVHGFDGFLRKPFGADELSSALRNLVQR